MLSFPDIWPKNWPVSVNWISSSAPWINAATQKHIEQIDLFGFQPLISSPAFHTKQTLESDLFLQCSVCASAGFTKKGLRIDSVLYFISSVFTVTMTALTFRKNSHWLVLPFVRLLLGTNRHDCNQTFFLLNSCLLTLRSLDGRNQCVSCRVMVFDMTHGSNCIQQDTVRHKMVPL